MEILLIDNDITSAGLDLTTTDSMGKVILETGIMEATQATMEYSEPLCPIHSILKDEVFCFH